jgi:hypothetical protein
MFAKQMLEAPLLRSMTDNKQCGVVHPRVNGAPGANQTVNTFLGV